jgi:plastocyanin
MMRRPNRWWHAACVVAFVSAGCGGGNTPPAPSPPANPNVVTITSAGVSPKQITVDQGARVLFVNNDTRPHNMTSDDHPDHLECPAINQVGLLQPGQQRETGNMVIVRTCGYHDHDNPDINGLKGQIITR